MQKISILNMPVGIFKINHKNQILYVNDFFCNLLEHPESELVGKQWQNVIHPDDKQHCLNSLAECMKETLSSFSFRFIGRNNNEIWVQCHIAPEDTSKKTIYYIGIFTDIRELKKAQAALQKLASFDPLTQLPNRYLFEELLTKSLFRAKRNQTTLALFYLDLDFFKNVNDYYGHAMGDAFLKEVGSRLKANLRESDYLIRLGGDEFAIILEDISNTSLISFEAQRLIDTMNAPFFIGDYEIMSGMSIGISVYPDEETNTETIVQHADQALYQAKASGRNCYKYYNKTMQYQLVRYMFILEHLHNAIQENQFELVYQPKINALNNTLIGMEALLRWNSSLLHSGPGEFIVIAEESGLMNQIGDWVFKTALTQYKEWYEKINLMQNIPISINISPSQLNDSSIIETIANTLKVTKIPTENILLELTETAVMKKALDNKSVLQIFFMELGIKLSIDDFGTGYSSLTYLKQLPIKELKIDKSFTDDIGINKHSEVIVKAIINLATTLGLDVIAEGVETKEQMQFLVENNCFYIQGYYYSKPLNVEQMTAFILKKEKDHLIYLSTS